MQQQEECSFLQRQHYFINLMLITIHLHKGMKLEKPPILFFSITLNSRNPTRCAACSKLYIVFRSQRAATILKPEKISAAC
ncbi:hypothetical protein EXN66_Car013729 [Channa argus]|uniref:Uncharacterized protein n=1 Tax=Channa argus TaxID=215402 RepID=A0A6G1Q708_CHAAH|nr:hypothetical protein EXN66_Car013729 [Channa argus]